MKKLILIVILVFTIMATNTISGDVKEEERCIFISYIELNEYINNDVDKSKMKIDSMISNIKKMKFNSIILQVRSNCDAVYLSKIYPNTYDFDVLDYFINVAHKNNIKVIAWINPYRVRTNSDINKIEENSPAYKYIDTDTLYVNNGIYFNPSKKEVEDLIVDGILEVLDYSIDGLLFDDYFYPSTDIDIDDYNEYINNNKYISLDEYHLYIINKMIKRVHDECMKKSVKFGVSPDGNIENNYNKNMADVRLWMKEDGYIDFIMPQIYYGFYNSTKSYVRVIKEWESLLKNDVDLYIALAFYKVGIVDNYAKEGRDEWINNDNIIMREVLLSRNLKNYKGFSLFRYDNVFDSNHYTNNSINEIENLKKIIN